MIKLKTLLLEITETFNATLIWLEKDGTVYNTNDTQHGLYVADNCGVFGVNKSLVQKVFKNSVNTR